MTLADTRLRRDIQKELVKRDIETNLIQVTVVNFVVYLDGELRPVRGMQFDLRKECGIIEDIIRQYKGVRDVVNRVRIPL